MPRRRLLCLTKLARPRSGRAPPQAPLPAPRSGRYCTRRDLAQQAGDVLAAGLQRAFRHGAVELLALQLRLELLDLQLGGFAGRLDLALPASAPARPAPGSSPARGCRRSRGCRPRAINSVLRSVSVGAASSRSLIWVSRSASAASIWLNLVSIAPRDSRGFGEPAFERADLVGARRQRLPGFLEQLVAELRARLQRLEARVLRDRSPCGAFSVASSSAVASLIRSDCASASAVSTFFRRACVAANDLSVSSRRRDSLRRVVERLVEQALHRGALLVGQHGPSARRRRCRPRAAPSCARRAAARSAVRWLSSRVSCRSVACCCTRRCRSVIWARRAVSSADCSALVASSALQRLLRDGEHLAQPDAFGVERRGAASRRWSGPRAACCRRSACC